MSIKSNLYSEKVFAENPLALWSLDDTCDYVSLISEANRDISSWAKTSGTVSEVNDLTSPFPESVVNRILLPVQDSEETSTVTFTSPDILNFTEINSLLKTFSFGLYIKPNSVLFKKISIGYEFYDEIDGATFRELKDFNYSDFSSWTHISATFDLPQQNVEMRLIVSFTIWGGNYKTEGITPNIQDYEFFVNGISLGQWSENYQATSLGIDLEDLPSFIDLGPGPGNLSLEGIKCIPAESYGTPFNKGYYLSMQKSLRAQNTSIPMVYGASNVTKLYPNYTTVEQGTVYDASQYSTTLWTDYGNGGFLNYNNTSFVASDSPEGPEEIPSTYITKEFPSLIIPGLGFLNESGKYKDYTVEMWLRFSADNQLPKRIFGPINSEDGLYVQSGFITLVISDNIKSFYIGESYRPMLVHISIADELATVLINGEQVISMALDYDQLFFPDKYSYNNKDQDWLGFYSYEDVSPVEVDSISFYPYRVAIPVAKRRFVYGQGVDLPESLSTAYDGVVASIDYSNAGYTNNYNYPDMASWSDAVYSNLDASGKFLKAPDYSLPTFYIGASESDFSDFQNDLKVINNEAEGFYHLGFGKYVDNSYMYFDNVAMLREDLISVTGVFKQVTNKASQILFKFKNKNTSEMIIVKKDSSMIKYLYVDFDGEITELDSFEFLSLSDKFSVGINIPIMKERFGDKISNFFNSINSISLSILGDATDKTLQFVGNVYSVGFRSAKNSIGIEEYFNENGFLEGLNVSDIQAQTASYELIAIKKYNKVFMDIAVMGYWEDYMPLSYFAKTIERNNGSEFYDLDFLQFNIDVPEPTQLLEKETVPGVDFKYKDLVDKFRGVTHKYLDNPLITGWDNYQDLAQNAEKYFEYDTRNFNVRSFVTFQYLYKKNVLVDTDFTIQQPPLEGRLIDINNFENWEVTKFEIVNGTLIYPNPNLVDFNELALCYSMEFNIRGILSNPVQVRQLQLASKALNENSFNPIGTKTGIELFPYTRSGILYDYKAKNPYSISKDIVPYLYLTRDSGITIRGDFDPTQSRGVEMVINSGKSDNYSVSAMQVWLRYDNKLFSPFPTKIFEIAYNGFVGAYSKKQDVIEFYMISDSIYGDRARIYALSKNTGKPVNGLSFYWNGILTREPRLVSKEWGILGVSFAQSLDFDSSIGAIRICGPVVFNHISYYKNNSTAELDRINTRPWADVESFERSNSLDWQYWTVPSVWEEVLVLGKSELYRVKPDAIFEAYTGTNKIVVDDGESLSILADTLKIYSKATWRLSTHEPS